MSRSQRDKDKSIQEKHQTILSLLLKDEDNKYCVDCDAKGPRWASWNLGIFLCIRCAGIHRNLGVHISRVKSVNLDSWTSEQMQMVQEMGNSRARAVYEANLPDDYRRPQTDSALEIFIREKYEKKKYIAKEWVPPQPKTQSNSVPEERKEKKRPKSKASGQIQLNSTSTHRPKSNASSNSPLSAPKAPNRPPPPSEKKPAASADLLGLDTPNPAVAPSANNSSDLFGDFLSAPAATTSPQKEPEGTKPPASNDSSSLFADMSLEAEKPKSTKDTIMALYGSGSSQQQQQPQMFGVPGATNPTPPMGTAANSGVNVGYYDPSCAGFGYYDPNTAGANCGYFEAGSANPPTSSATNFYDQGGMYMPQQQPQYAMMQNGAIAQPNNMMPGNIPMMQQQQPQQGMMMNQNVNMGVGGGNMQYMAAQPNMYNNQAQQQQQHLSQIQNQMASMKVTNPGVAGMGVGMQQQAQPVGAGGMGWGAQQAGHTLSNNLWQ